MTDAPKRKRGRPPAAETKQKRRSPHTADEKSIVTESILTMLHDGPAESLADACRRSGVTVGQFLTWVEKDTADLKDRYARARVALLDRMAEGLIDISDTSPNILPTGAIDSAFVAHQKLRIDTRKWLLSKLAPKKYGDKIEVSGGPSAIKTVVEWQRSDD